MEEMCNHTEAMEAEMANMLHAEAMEVEMANMLILVSLDGAKPLQHSPRSQHITQQIRDTITENSSAGTEKIMI